VTHEYEEAPHPIEMDIENGEHEVEGNQMKGVREKMKEEDTVSMGQLFLLMAKA
jgi:hypothetical protein